MACAATSGLLWYGGFSAGLFPLLLAGIPLSLLFLFSKEPPPPVYSVVAIALFLASAAIGILTAYQPEPATAKFWVITGSIFICFALIAQPIQNLRLVFWFLAFTGLGLSIYFLLGYDWLAQPADLMVINRLGRSWMSVRPDLPVSTASANVFGGILAVLLMLTLGLWLDAWRKRQAVDLAFTGLLLLGQGAGLLMTSSRAAWGAVALGVLALAFWIASKRFGRLKRIHPFAIFQRVLLVSTGIVVVGLLLFPSQLYALAKDLPGADSAGTRAGLFINTLKLLPDFWVFGGGLTSFSGLYSQYVLVIPFEYFRYSHNLFLDLLIEQGWLGLLAFTVLVVACLLKLLAGFRSLHHHSRTLRSIYPIIFSGWIVFLAHGLFDDPFYGEKGTPLFFLMPGLTLLVLKPVMGRKNESKTRQRRRLPRFGVKYWGAGLLVLIFAFGLAYSQQILGAIYANLGAVRMAKIELADFPRQSWADTSLVDELEQVEPTFRQALWYNPESRTANHRLGLIYLARRDFSQAQAFFEAAQHSDPTSRGVIKSLGFTYVWNGEYTQAYRLLQILPEAESELDAYVTWWQTENRPDLARKAAEMRDFIQSAAEPRN